LKGVLREFFPGKLQDLVDVDNQDKPVGQIGNAEQVTPAEAGDGFVGRLDRFPGNGAKFPGESTIKPTRRSPERTIIKRDWRV